MGERTAVIEPALDALQAHLRACGLVEEEIDHACALALLITQGEAVIHERRMERIAMVQHLTKEDAYYRDNPRGSLLAGLIDDVNENNHRPGAVLP